MRFFTSQVLSGVNISTETLRHWKRTLPPIRARDGRSEGYTFRELAAMAVIARAVHDLSVPISRFTTFARELFDGIDPLRMTDDYVLCITQTEMRLTNITDMPDSTSLAMVRIAPVIAELRAALAIDPGEGNLQQLVLPLGPKIIPFKR
ncbi:hypothetical protein [Bradyrhizobium diversitatis]|uniref:HTH merR-type domain-containing protein n=1 Tax=Bradyrhizobium diversitatis TaxID=2755406 RepID=A0ABS0NVL8_9BRAD|nr:hypothetical protein [Bradyrhizobium diversitatis]MBH5385056.1 hypothetical protein [Bradyrhizobium diversitatis]